MSIFITYHLLSFTIGIHPNSSIVMNVFLL